MLRSSKNTPQINGLEKLNPHKKYYRFQSKVTSKKWIWLPDYHTKKEMYSRDTTVSLDLMSCTTPACFSTFFNLATIVLTLLKN